MPAFARGSHYAINILAADQKALAERFAAKDVDRWAGVAFARASGGAPVLVGAAAASSASTAAATRKATT